MKDLIFELMIVFGVIIVSCLLTFVPVYFLWNWLMPELFGLTKITFLQAFGLSALCSCLFKSSSSKK